MHPNAGINNFSRRKAVGGRSTLQAKIKKVIGTTGLLKVPKGSYVINEDESVSIRVTTLENLILRMAKIAMGDKDREAMLATDWLITRLYGKPTEHIELEKKRPITEVTFTVLDNKDAQANKDGQS